MCSDSWLYDKNKILFFREWLSLAAKHRMDVENGKCVCSMFLPCAPPWSISWKWDGFRSRTPSFVNLQLRCGSHHLNVLRQGSCHLLNLFCCWGSYLNVPAIDSNFTVSTHPLLNRSAFSVINCQLHPAKNFFNLTSRCISISPWHPWLVLLPNDWNSAY